MNLHLTFVIPPCVPRHLMRLHLGARCKQRQAHTAAQQLGRRLRIVEVSSGGAAA